MRSGCEGKPGSSGQAGCCAPRAAAQGTPTPYQGWHCRLVTVPSRYVPGGHGTHSCEAGSYSLPSAGGGVGRGVCVGGHPCKGAAGAGRGVPSWARWQRLLQAAPRAHRRSRSRRRGRCRRRSPRTRCTRPPSRRHPCCRPCRRCRWSGPAAGCTCWPGRERSRQHHRRSRRRRGCRQGPRRGEEGAVSSEVVGRRAPAHPAPGSHTAVIGPASAPAPPPARRCARTRAGSCQWSRPCRCRQGTRGLAATDRPGRP